MRASPKRFYEGKPVIETDFFVGQGWLVELVRIENFGLVLIHYKDDGTKWKSSLHVPSGESVLCPPVEDEITRHVRFASRVGIYASAQDYLEAVDSFLARCLDLDQRYRFLLACFVLSTWVVDRLPVAPYVALVGLPRSGKSTALRALHLVCRRGMITSDISSAAFYRACDRLTPTICIDEAATAGQKRTLFHLLRSGTTRDAVAFRQGQSYHAYGAKVVAWTEMPDDDALNSRCIVIPMQETMRTDLLRTTDPEIVERADNLQGHLLMYRFKKYNSLKLPPIPRYERLRSRDRDLYEALALPIGEDPKACARLLECLEYQHDLNREPLPSNQMAVLESLFKQIHLQPGEGAYALRQLKNGANLNLGALGERFHWNEKAVSGVLKTFGFLNRKRTNSGWVVQIDRAARKRIHELLSLYGVDSPAACLPSQAPNELCEFCQPQDPRNPEPPSIEHLARETSAEPGGPSNLASTISEHSEHGELGEHKNDAEERPRRWGWIENQEDQDLVDWVVRGEDLKKEP